MEKRAGISRDELITGYVDALIHGYAAVFAGAGLSSAAGFVDWKGLLTEFADELGLDLDTESDLVTVAQYHLNHEHQNRLRLHKKLVEAFGSPIPFTNTHQILASLPISTYWTSNYDPLIEAALRASGKSVAVRKSSASLTSIDKKVDASVYKLHGDLSDPDTIIITRDDYVRYAIIYPGFRDRLRSDLMRRTFLFLGFSFSDPHLDFVLSELKRDLGQNIRAHYSIMRRESPEGRSPRRFRYALNRQKLHVEDLERYGIKTLLVDRYDEIPDLLDTIRLRYLRSQLFVSGAAADFNPRGRQWIDQLGSTLGKEIIERGYNLVSGFGLGIGPSVVTGAIEALYRLPNPNIDRRLLLRPFPINVTRNRQKIFTQYRTSMLQTVGFAIFMSGNRETQSGPELSPGVWEEYEISKSIGAYPLPVASTGWQAAQIWADAESNFAAVFPRNTPRRPWLKLKQANASVEEVVSALFQLIDFLGPR